MMIEQGWECGLGSIDSEQGEVAGTCEHGYHKTGNVMSSWISINNSRKTLHADTVVSVGRTIFRLMTFARQSLTHSRPSESSRAICYPAVDYRQAPHTCQPTRLIGDASACLNQHRGVASAGVVRCEMSKIDIYWFSRRVSDHCSCERMKSTLTCLSEESTL